MLKPTWYLTDVDWHAQLPAAPRLHGDGQRVIGELADLFSDESPLNPAKTVATMHVMLLAAEHLGDNITHTTGHHDLTVLIRLLGGLNVAGSPRSPSERSSVMSLYPLTPKPGCERYTVQVGWNPHRTLFANVTDHTWNPDTDPDDEPDSVSLGLVEDIFDPAVVLAAVEPYTVIPEDLIHQLRADMREHPVRQSIRKGRDA